MRTQTRDPYSVSAIKGVDCILQPESDYSQNVRKWKPRVDLSQNR